MKKRPQSKKRRAVPVPIASMGDIAFLLIIFFMVCSEVSKDKKMQVVLPLSEHVKKMQAVVVARIAVDENGEIFFDGTRVDNAKDVEWGVRALLTSTISDDQRHVQFKCDSSLPKETFEPVIKAIAAAGGIIEAVGEKQP
ncbi:MAG: biopolymer transporter ExbD [Verrucomicrobiae bacterium]|nr:biopolymer transporter ExbD [Verrucomicrobiae bacterium]NNJ43905.1 biopolymer transporter ExbD [Akkermansiaceae bacterium]